MNRQQKQSLRPILALLLLLASGQAAAAVYTLTVAGLGGDGNYESRFNREAEQIHSAISRGAMASYLSGLGATRETILGELERWSREMQPQDQAVMVLVGHGSYAEGQYRFNVVGPDLTGQELSAAMDALPAGRQLLVNTSSASGALLEALADKPGRVVITATKNGRELQATRFSTYFAQSLSRPSADLDKDQQISVDEAFGFARGRVADYFNDEGLLATEHPRQRGGEPKSLILARLDQLDQGPEGRPDAATASPELLARRQSLNDQIRALRARRDELDQAQYLSELQALLVSLSQVSEEIESAGQTP